MARAGWTNLEQAMRELESELTQIVRGLTIYTWNSILSKTPQYYGRMAASWTYRVGSTPAFYDRSGEVQSRMGPSREQLEGYDDPGTFHALWKGHPQAIAIANSHSAGADAGFKLGDTVWITNGVDHGEGPYSAAIENGEIRLRMYNMPGTPVKQTVEQLLKEFSAQSGRARAWSQSVVNLKKSTIGGQRV